MEKSDEQIFAEHNAVTSTEIVAGDNGTAVPKTIAPEEGKGCKCEACKRHRGEK